MTKSHFFACVVLLGAAECYMQLSKEKRVDYMVQLVSALLASGHYTIDDDPPMLKYDKLPEDIVKSLGIEGNTCPSALVDAYYIIADIETIAERSDV